MGAVLGGWNSVEQVSGECSVFHAVPPGMRDSGRMERLEQGGTVFRGLFTVSSGGTGAREDGRKGVWHQWRFMQDTPRAVEAYNPIIGSGWW